MGVVETIRWKTMSSFRPQTQPINLYSPGTRSGLVDVEAGDVHPRGPRNPSGGGVRIHHDVTLSPGARTSRSGSLSTSVQHSPRGTRFMDGIRRRIRQASLNLPAEPSLDEDLGYPPVCSPPPEVYCGSVGDNRNLPSMFRNRSQSDAHPAMISTTQRRRSGGGLLVFFPSSSSSSNSGVNNSSASLQGGMQSRRNSCSQDEPMDISDFRADHHDYDEMSTIDDDDECGTSPGTVIFDGNPADISIGGSNPNSPRSSMDSPRRPLFVDTQLANTNGDASKKRSPVTTMVDFMRGRNRTNSLQLSSSPLVSPQTIAARTSASVDGQAMFSPGRRPPLSRLYQRSSFGGTSGGNGGMKSFDSGLDLTSPTINHTALLIKEASLFSTFDSMAIGGASSDFNAIFFDNHNAVYSLFMKAHKCYDLIPTSTKLVVFDTHLPVRKAFYALVYNGVRAAPLWDSDKQQFIGMLTITDFIKILIRHYEAGDNAERMRALENQQISHWREQFEQDGCLTPLVSIDPNESLHRAVQVLCESKVHRLPVLDKRTGNITYILTHKRLIKFLSLYMNDLPKPEFMTSTPRELGIGSWGDVLSCHVGTPLHDALELFLKNRVSALPLIDEQGRVVDIYAKFDVISLAAENSYDKLDCTVQEALSHRSEWFEGVHTCLETDPLHVVMETIVKAEVHRLIVTDKDKKVVGVVSLSDILKYLILDPAQQPPMSFGATSSTPMPRTSSASTAGSNDSPPSSIPEAVEIDEDN